MWLSSFWRGAWLSSFLCNVCLLSLWCDIYLCEGDSNEQSIYNQLQENKSMIINMLHNWNNLYCNHNSNIKCVASTIKCIGFELIYYAVNLDIVSSFMVFSDFNYMFLPIYY